MMQNARSSSIASGRISEFASFAPIILSQLAFGSLYANQQYNIYNCAYKTLFANSLTNKDQVQVKRNEAIATGHSIYRKV